MSLVTEAQLVVPALILLDQATGGQMPTSELSRQLRALLRPSGQDLAILANRNDDHFSQKVRNLKSHDTLKRQGLAEHIPSGFRITDKGRQIARSQSANVTALADFPLDTSAPQFEDMGNGAEVVVIDENIVTEGQLSTRNVTYRTRSRQLRDAAIEHYTKVGKIPCSVCSFDYGLAYVGIGTGYIQIHHLEPISYNGETRLALDEAVRKVRPLCANCHVMVHRRHPWLSVERVTDLLHVTYDYANL